MMQKESIISAAFKNAVVKLEGLDADAYILDANAIIQYGRCVLSHNGEETFFYKDQPIVTFFRAEIRNSGTEHKFIFEQKYKVHTV